MTDATTGSSISSSAEIGDGVVIGTGVVIHDDVVIGDGCELQDGCIIGKPPALSAHSTAGGGDLATTRIGEGVKICAGAIVFAGVEIGERSVVGDRAIVRERVGVGTESVIGAGAIIENDVSIGGRVKIQTLANITAGVTIEDEVFVGPGVLTTNDNSAGRSPETPNVGPTLRRRCRIGAGAVLLPEVEIGENAFVAAGAVVTVSIAPGMLAVGVPAREIRAIVDS